MEVDAATSALVVSAATIGLAIGVLGILLPFALTFGLLLTRRVLEGAVVGGVPVIAIADLSEEAEASDAARAAGRPVNLPSKTLRRSHRH